MADDTHRRACHRDKKSAIEHHISLIARYIYYEMERKKDGYGIACV